MLRKRHRVVEEHHEAVAREVLERSGVREDQLARDGVIRADDIDQFLRFGRLHETGEPAKIEVDDAAWQQPNEPM